MKSFQTWYFQEFESWLLISSCILFSLYLSKFKEEDIALLQQKIESSIANKISYEIEHPIYLNKNVKWILGYGEPILDADNNVVKIRGIAQDGYSMMKTNIPEHLDWGRNLQPGAITNDYGRKKDPNAPNTSFVKYMHGINRISIFLFIVALVILAVKLIKR